jgi:hypothetical protein
MTLFFSVMRGRDGMRERASRGMVLFGDGLRFIEIVPPQIELEIVEQHASTGAVHVHYRVA